MSQHIAIIGAGPIGIEAALAAKHRGCSFSIYDSGNIADAVQRWGHVRMFSPFSMNASKLGISVLGQLGYDVPAEDDILTGAEFAKQYLIPLGEFLGVKTKHRVKAIARDGSCKRDHIAEPTRADTRFRLLIENSEGEQHDFADIIFDCTGLFSQPNPLGDGGIPALGEVSLRSAIRYGIADTADLSAHAGKRTLVVGGGHSASTVVVALSKLTGATVTWINKKPGTLPCARIADDPLPERDQLSAAANELVTSRSVTFISTTTVNALKKTDSGIRVTLRHRDGTTSEIETDLIIATTGYRPDTSLARELHVQNCWATEGTYPLAASLLGETGGDCLAVTGFGADTLKHPEPNYFALGMKSYGRSPDFLIRTGREQVDSLLDWLDKRGKKS
jgi:thioredoxin reductase